MAKTYEKIFFDVQSHKIYTFIKLDNLNIKLTQ